MFGTFVAALCAALVLYGAWLVAGELLCRWQRVMKQPNRRGQAEYELIRDRIEVERDAGQG